MLTPTEATDRTAVIAQDWLPGYELLSVIGSGGFGTVYKARQLKLDRLVAVKVIRKDLMDDPDQEARFETEAVVLGKFRHPNIVHVYDLGCHAGRLYLAEELLDGEDLGEYLKRDGRLSERVAWQVARQAAAGLAHASVHGVVHRDVKPANLFLTPHPTGVGWPTDVPLVKVMDFGIARVKWAVDPDGFPRTHRGCVVGTPAYMAPEQHEGVDDLDHRADIYALGATIGHALTGRAPFAGKTVWDVMANKLAGTPNLGDALTPASAGLVRAMIDPDRASRIPTYEELIRRIDDVLAGWTEPNERRHGRRIVPRLGRRAATALVAVSGLALATGGWYGLVPANRARPPKPDPTYVSSGDQQFLFTGSPDVFQWRAPEAGGNWAVEQDGEGVHVLAGTGFNCRAFRPPAAEYRVTLGLDLYQAAAAEVHFAIPSTAPESSPRYALRLNKQDGAVLGTRVGSRGPFTPISDPVAFPPAAWFDGRQPYLEIRIDSTDGGWVAWFNGIRVGRVDRTAGPVADEIRIAAEGGKARIDSAILETIRQDLGR